MKNCKILIDFISPFQVDLQVYKLIKYFKRQEHFILTIKVQLSHAGLLSVTKCMFLGPNGNRHRKSDGDIGIIFQQRMSNTEEIIIVLLPVDVSLCC